MIDHEECGKYYLKTGKIPPVNLHSWVPVYNILVNAGYSDILKTKKRRLYKLRTLFSKIIKIFK